MQEDKNKLKELKDYLIDLFNEEKDFEILKLLENSTVKVVNAGNCTMGIVCSYHKLLIGVPKDIFSKYQERVLEIEEILKDKAEDFFIEHKSVNIIGLEVFELKTKDMPESKKKILWYKINDLFTKDELIKEIDYLKDTVKIAAQISEEIEKIETLNEEFIPRSKRVNVSLEILLEDTFIHYNNLWAWILKWNSNNLKSNIERVDYIDEIYDKLLSSLQENRLSNNDIV